MECRRCHGLMVEEWCTELDFDGYIRRCVNCGAILDPTIERNQTVPPAQRRLTGVAS